MKVLLLHLHLGLGVLALAWASLRSEGGVSPQTLTWDGTTNALLNLQTAYPLGAAASSGLPVTLRVETGPAVWSDGSITCTQLGTVWVTAEQLGNADYAPVQLTRSFNVRAAALTARGAAPTRGSAAGVQVVGNRAYIADGDAGLVILDVSEPDKPVQLTEFATSSSAFAVQVLGHLAYLAVGGAGLQVVDVGNPVAPVSLSVWNTAGVAYDLQVRDTLAFVAAGHAGLQVVDVSHPDVPVGLGGYVTENEARSVQVVGSLAYVALGYSGLVILDISNPAGITQVGGLSLGHFARTVHVSGNVAYVSGLDNGVSAIDVSTPATPRVVGTYPLTQANAAQVVGNYAWVADGDSGLVALDVSLPSQPLQVGQIKANGYTYGLQVVGNFAYLANGSAGLQIVDLKIGYPQTLSWQGTAGDILTPKVTYPLTARSSNGLPVTVRVDRSPAVVSNETITVMSTFPANIWVVATQAGDETYLPAELVRVFNLRKAQITPVGAFKTYPDARDVQVIGNRAYMVETGIQKGAVYLPGGLRILDVTHPDNPVQLGQYQGTVTNAVAVQVVDGLAYVADVYAGLQIISVGNPAAPWRVGGYDRSAVIPLGLNVVGNHAYLATGSAGLAVINVLFPNNFSLMGTGVTGGYARDVQVSGDFAYVAANSAGLQILDISHPEAPVRLGGYDSAGLANGVQVVGQYVYLADGSAGLQVLDISNPAKPVRVGACETNVFAQSVHVVGDHAFIASGVGGLRIVDISHPGRPVLVGEAATTGAANSVYVAGDYLYAAEWMAGLQIFQLRYGFPQELTRHLPPELLWQREPVETVGVASSGLPLGVTVVSGPAVVVNQQLTWTGVGSVTLRVEQAGDADFLPVSAQWTITVLPPRLGVEPGAFGWELHWPVGVANLQLQFRDSLEPASPWAEFPGVAVEANGEWHRALEASATQKYFRLHQP